MSGYCPMISLPNNHVSLVLCVLNKEKEKPSLKRIFEEAFGLKGSSVTSLLQGLERKSFITRRSDPADERRKFVTVLPKGQVLMSDFETAFREMDEKMMHGVTPEQQQALVEALELMVRNLEY